MKVTRNRARSGRIRSARLKTKLVRRMHSLLHDVAVADDVRLHRSEAPSADEVDAAGDLAEQELFFRVAEIRSGSIRQIDDAIRRIDAGDYGHCANCGERIPAARLRIVPAASLCVCCQRAHERLTYEWAGDPAWDRVAGPVADDMNDVLKLTDEVSGRA